MLRQLLKISYLTRRSERNAVVTRTSFEAFKDLAKLPEIVFWYPLNSAFASSTARWLGP